MDDDSEKMDDDREKMDNGSEKSNGKGIQSSSPEKQQQYLTAESSENGAGNGSPIQTVGNSESNVSLEPGDLDISDYDIEYPVFSSPEDWKNEEEALGAASFTGLAVNQHNAELGAAAQHLQPALRQPDAVKVLRQQPCSAIQQLAELMEEGLVTKAELHILQVAVRIGQKANRINLRQPFAVEVLDQQPCPALQQVAVIREEALVTIPELLILDEAVRIGHRVNRRKRRLLMWERGLGHGS